MSVAERSQCLDALSDPHSFGRIGIQRALQVCDLGVDRAAATRSPEWLAHPAGARSSRPKSSLLQIDVDPLG
jgi:hypothetical protein